MIFLDFTEVRKRALRLYYFCYVFLILDAIFLCFQRFVIAEKLLRWNTDQNPKEFWVCLTTLTVLMEILPAVFGISNLILLVLNYRKYNSQHVKMPKLEFVLKMLFWVIPSHLFEVYALTFILFKGMGFWFPNSPRFLIANHTPFTF